MEYKTPKGWIQKVKDMKRGTNLFPTEKPPLFDLRVEEIRSAKKEYTERRQLAELQYEALGTQNTLKVVSFAMKLSDVGCLLLLRKHKEIHPEFLRILRQNYEELYDKAAERLFVYALATAL